MIIDDMDKDGEEHEYTWNFHTTANHRIIPDEQGFVAKSMTKAEAIKLWKDRGINIAGKLRGWPGPSSRYPWEKEVHVDLRLGMVWPEKYTHKVTYKGANWRTKINIPDHLQVSQKADEALFFALLYPERIDRNIRMPKWKRIEEGNLTGVTIGADTILFSRNRGVWKYKDIETDGRLVYVTRAGGGKVTGWAVAEATVLSVGGKSIFASPGRRVTAAGPPAVQDDGGDWRATQVQRGMPD